MPDHHLDLDELAELAEGLLVAERAQAVEQHLAGCARCRDDRAALARVTPALASEPAPVMPDAVAARLQATLRAESARRAADAPVSPRYAGELAATRSTSGSSGGAHALTEVGSRGDAGHRTVTPAPRPSLGPFAPTGRRSTWHRWAPALAAAALACTVGFGGYVASATAGLNEPPVMAVALDSEDLAAQARTVAETRDLDPHRFSSAWFCARSVTPDRITGLAGASVDGSPALLVYTRSSGTSSVVVVAGCNGLRPRAVASAVLPR